MEILFLSHRMPYPPNKGDKICSHAMIRHLAKHHTVHLACFVDDPNDWTHTDTVRRQVGGECLFVPLRPATKWFRAASALLTGQPMTTAYFGSPKMARWVRSLVARRSIDRAIVYSTAMAPYILNTSGFDPTRVIFDMQDIDSDKWRQYSLDASLLKRWIFRREAKVLLRLERDAAAKFGVDNACHRLRSGDVCHARSGIGKADLRAQPWGGPSKSQEMFCQPVSPR